MTGRRRARLGWRGGVGLAIALWLAVVLVFSARSFTDVVPARADAAVSPGAVYEARCGAPFGRASVRLLSSPEQAQAVPSRTPCRDPRATRRLLAVGDTVLGGAAVVLLVTSTIRRRRA